MGRLDEKVAIVTGGGGTIGRESALLFAAEGASVVVADSDESAALRTASAVREAGGEVSIRPVDMTQRVDVEALVAFTVATYGALHVLFNNAGILPADDAGLLDTPEPTWEQVLAVNLTGVWLGCRAAVPAMLRSGGGAIVNVASMVALMGSATPQMAYTASKGGVLSLTREVAVEYARRGIRANALCPGPIDTPLIAELLADPEQRERRFVHIPMGRMGRPEEVARAALFLASDDSSFMTGASLVVDGGITAAYVTPQSPVP